IWLFLAVSVLAIGFLGYLFAASRRGQWFYQILLGMLLAGVLGNMYDRIVYGYVRDMIHALPRWDVFPWIFNIADSLLCVGVALMLAYTVFVKDQSEPQPAAVANTVGPPPVEATQPVERCPHSLMKSCCAVRVAWT